MKPTLLSAILRRLLQKGSLPESACSRSFIREIRPLINGGIVAWEKSGSGRRLAIYDTSAFTKFLSSRFPEKENAVATEPLRIQGVARFRDSKALRGTGEEFVFVRGWQDGVLLRNGRPVPVTDGTREYGVFAFVLHPDSPYTLTGKVATVENPTAFSKFERLGTNLPLAIYLRGCLSKRLLNWLQREVGSGLEIIHFGDYDPSGLREYLGLRSLFGEQVQLYLPSNLSELFRRYSKRKLLEQRKSQAILQDLRKIKDSSVQAIVSLMDETNAGLEQEALLIANS